MPLARGAPCRRTAHTAEVGEFNAHHDALAQPMPIPSQPCPGPIAKTGGSAQRQLPQPPIHLQPKVLTLRRDDGLKATHICVAVPLHEGVAKRTAVCVGCPNQLTTQSVSLDALTCKLHEQTPTAPEPAQQRDA